MHELVINLHMHTTYSDGHASHASIAKAAMNAGLDAVIVTDHNVFVNGPEGYYQEGDRRVLLLVGEEIHDQAREPQKNHLMVFGAGRELATYAPDPQNLLDMARQAGGLPFIAHPIDPASPAVGETDISWVDWNVTGYTGIELWNAMSEFKGRLKTILHAVFLAFFPTYIAQGPYPQAIEIWDRLTSQGKRVVAIGGSDAHALPARLGPIRKTLFPYDFHFRCVNTHLLVNEPLTGNPTDDRKTVLEALKLGHCFIGYDLPQPTTGFRFTAQTQDGTVNMGDLSPAGSGVTMQVKLPGRADARLIRNGKVIKCWRKRELYTYITSEPGVYRVEAYVEFRGARRGWIFSNPIYLI